MSSTALLAPAARSRPAAGRKPASDATLMSAPDARHRGAKLAWRLAAALAGSLILVVALVDPLLGSDRYDVHPEMQDRGVSHG